MFVNFYVSLHYHLEFLEHIQLGFSEEVSLTIFSKKAQLCPTIPLKFVKQAAVAIDNR